MKLYQAFDVDEETPVQFLAVHPLRWRPEWGEPKIMFREVDDETQALADAAPALLEACKPFAAIAAALPDYSEPSRPVYSFDGIILTAEDFRRAAAAIAQAKGEQ
jgi:hypothetical protein